MNEGPRFGKSSPEGPPDFDKQLESLRLKALEEMSARRPDAAENEAEHERALGEAMRGLNRNESSLKKSLPEVAADRDFRKRLQEDHQVGVGLAVHALERIGVSTETASRIVSVLIRRSAGPTGASTH